VPKLTVSAWSPEHKQCTLNFGVNLKFLLWVTSLTLQVKLKLELALEHIHTVSESLGLEMTWQFQPLTLV
jgi:hypothetical protein